MIVSAKEKIILAGFILSGILTLTSCGSQKRETVPNLTEIEEAVEYTGETEVEDEAAVFETTEAIFEAAETEAEISAEEDRIDTDDVHDSAEAFLTDLDIHPLYAAFLRNEISVPNPYMAGSELSFFDDRMYSQEEHTFESATKCFSLVDVNNDGISELVFKIYESPDELMYILGVQGDRLICYDVYETHTSHMAFGIYDNGIVTWGQNYDGDEDIYYSFDSEGKPYELIHFVREDTASDSDLFYDYYYLDGDETTKCILQSNEEYKNLISPYEGEEPEWFSCRSFADMPKE
ncbi:MAG: hypothetical protein K2M22_12905 [Lachnospiraceae bacterium]|nr:hypothetical protein [Lachnospiraceae bacterium]MDE7176196.1 hypothetical protein [Lachnospiraceae bacterium]